MKIMVTVWRSKTGLIRYSFQNLVEKSITAEMDCQEINQMNQKLQGVCPALVNEKKGPILFHGNAWPHVAQRTLQKLIELVYETLPHPTDSPDL